MDNPVRVARKVAGAKVTTLRILEERHFGSLTCHVLRSKERPLFDHFLANSSTAFRSANAYDPYIYGKKTHRFLTCDVYLGELLTNHPVDFCAMLCNAIVMFNSKEKGMVPLSISIMSSTR